MITMVIPPCLKSGGDTSPPSPHDLRHCLEKVRSKELQKIHQIWEKKSENPTKKSSGFLNPNNPRTLFGE